MKIKKLILPNDYNAWGIIFNQGMLNFVFGSKGFYIVFS